MTDKEDNPFDKLFRNTEEKDQRDAEVAIAEEARIEEIYANSQGGFGQALKKMDADPDINKLEKARRYDVAIPVLLGEVSRLEPVVQTASDPEQAHQPRSVNTALDAANARVKQLEVEARQIQQDLTEANTKVENLQAELTSVPVLTVEERELLDAFRSKRVFKTDFDAWKDKQYTQLRKDAQAAKQTSKPDFSDEDKSAELEPSSDHPEVADSESAPESEAAPSLANDKLKTEEPVKKSWFERVGDRLAPPKSMK